MNEKREPGSALACVPNAIDAAAQPEHLARIKRLFGQAVWGRTSITKGYEFVFDVSELDEVAKFVSLERKCCPFLSFELEIPSGLERVRLRIQGPPGSRELIEAELLELNRHTVWP